MHPRRALLYMPGDDRRKIEKATTLGADSICMDMEDGVAITQKQEARAVIAQAMKELDFGKSERCIRINGVGSGFEKFDLAAAVALNADDPYSKAGVFGQVTINETRWAIGEGKPQ